MGLQLYVTQPNISRSHCGSQIEERAAVPGGRSEGGARLPFPTGDGEAPGRAIRTATAQGWHGGRIAGLGIEPA